MELDTRNQFRAVEWLGDVVHAANFESLGGEFFIGGCGEENDGDLAGDGVFLEDFAEVDASHARHHDVEENEIREDGFEFEECLLGALGGDDFVAVFEEECADDLDVLGFIVDDEDDRGCGVEGG